MFMLNTLKGTDLFGTANNIKKAGIYQPWPNLTIY